MAVVQAPVRFEGDLSIGGRRYTLRADVEGDESRKLWPCSFALAEIVAAEVSRLPLFRGLTVCELGAGLGLPGIVAAGQGAEVTFVEKNPGACVRIAEAVRAQGLESRCYIRNECWTVARAEYDVLLGADVIYATYGLSALAGFVARSLKEGGLGLFANTMPTNFAAWRELLSAAGISAECEERETLLPDGQRASFYLWRLAR